MGRLSSEDLKEERDAHSIQPVHLSGPLHRRPTCCIDKSQSKSGSAAWDSIVYFWRKASTNGAVTTIRSQQTIAKVRRTFFFLTYRGCGDPKAIEADIRLGD